MARTVPMHTVPVNDLIEHELTGHCVCGPDWKFWTCEHGDIQGPIIVHHALDGRERAEV